MNKDTLISIDFETMGPVPGIHSAVSIGAVAFYDGQEVDSFYAKMKELPWGKRDPDTLQWWQGQPAAWEEIQKDQEEPKDVMERFYNWGVNLPGTSKTRVFAANPACYDAGFLWFYCYRFLRKEKNYTDICHRLRVLDIRSYWAAISGMEYSQAERYKMPKEWAKDLEINHRAVDDARQQGHTLMRMTALAAGAEE